MKFRRSLLVMGDSAIGFLSFLAGLVIRFGWGSIHAEMAVRTWRQPFAFVLLLLIASWLTDAYTFQQDYTIKRTFKTSLATWVIAFGTLSVLFYVLPSLLIGRGLLAISLGVFTVLQVAWHLTLRSNFSPRLHTNILVLGTGDAAKRCGEMIEAGLKQFGHVLVGYISCGMDDTGALVPKEKIVGPESELKRIVTQKKISKIILAASEMEAGSIFNNILLRCKLKGVEVIDFRSFYEEMTGKLMLNQIDIQYLICSSGFSHDRLVFVAKRAMDVVFAIIGLIVSSPLWPLIGALVKIDSPGSVFYRQVRVGYMENPFTLYKFRTMGMDAESETGAVWAQENDSRLRPIGKFLRKTRLDELPQLINVLKGEMSFVGPRPERPEFVEQLNEQLPFYAKRHFIKPGITGWAQINYPYGASVEDAYEKLCYDLFYFKKLSLWMDVLIILATLKVLLLSRGSR